MENFRAGIPWQSFAGVPGFFVGTNCRDPHFTFLRQIDKSFPELEAAVPAEVARRLAKAETEGMNFAERSAVWTYLTTDQPFGAWTERIMKGIARSYWAAENREPLRYRGRRNRATSDQPARTLISAC